MEKHLQVWVLFFDEVVINSCLAKILHELCMQESTCHEMVIDLL